MINQQASHNLLNFNFAIALPACYTPVQALPIDQILMRKATFFLLSFVVEVGAPLSALYVLRRVKWMSGQKSAIGRQIGNFSDFSEFLREG